MAALGYSRPAWLRRAVSIFAIWDSWWGAKASNSRSVAGGFLRGVETVAHEVVVAGQFAIPNLEFFPGKLGFELEAVGQTVAECHRETDVGAVAAEHGAISEAYGVGWDGKLLPVEGRHQRRGDLGEHGVRCAVCGDVDLAEAELVAAGGGDCAAQGAGKKLGT